MSKQFNSSIFFLALTVIATLATGCVFKNESQMDLPVIPFEMPKFKSAPSRFQSCAELQNWRDEKWRQWADLNSQYSAWASVSGGVSIATSESGGTPSARPPAWPEGNNQEQTVHEPDTAKRIGDLVFYIRKISQDGNYYLGSSPLRFELMVLNSKDMRVVLMIPIESESRPLLQTVNGRLILLSEKQQVTEMRVFQPDGDASTDLSTSLKLESFRRFSGSYSDSRALNGRPLSGSPNGRLILVTEKWLGGGDVTVSSLGISCENILKSPVEDFSFDLTLVRSISVSDRGEIEVQTVGRLGRADQLYMTEQSLYLFSSGFRWFFWDPRLAIDPTALASSVARFELADSGEIKFGGVAPIDGHVRNQYSFSESQDREHLFVATTVQGSSAGLFARANRIWTLEKRGLELHTVAATEEFGAREDIRSVRFVGDRAFVVTFLMTDPLFTFDLSDPLKLRLLSHLEIPGFSAYLHRAANDTLLGIGYSAGAWGERMGLQFSLFQPHSDGSMGVVTQITVAGSNSHADVGRTPRAFMYLTEQETAIVPLRIIDENGALQFSGAYLLETKQGLRIAHRWTHESMMPRACRERKEWTWWTWANESLDIQRLVRVRGGVMAISPFGATLHKAESPWSEMARVKFEPHSTNVDSERCLNTY